MSPNEVAEHFARMGGFAFPSKTELAGGGTLVTSGMTLRDWFAGQALVGMLAATGSYGMGNGPDDNAERAYEHADAMLAFRAKAEART